MTYLYTHEIENPFILFTEWYEKAKKSELNDPNAMALATATKDGKPSCRMVLLKEIHDNCFIFYTNMESRKGKQIIENPHCALTFHWKSLEKQIRIEGDVTLVDDKTADDYYHSRPRDSQIGAWASQQSRPLAKREDLIESVTHFSEKFKDEKVIPRPPYWTGFRVKPNRIEFWQAEEFRLHDRLVFTRKDETSWTQEKLYP